MGDRLAKIDMGHIVSDGDPTPPKGAQPPLFGQTAGWIKMPLSTEVGLGPGLPP